MRHTPYYGAINWQPLIIGAWKLGGSAGILNGYPSRARGGAFFAALPMATYEGQRFGVNVGLIPSVGQVDGAVVVQFKVRASADKHQSDIRAQMTKCRPDVDRRVSLSST